MLGLILTLALPIAAPAGDVVSLPTTPAPQQCLVSLDKEGHIVLSSAVSPSTERNGDQGTARRQRALPRPALCRSSPFEQKYASRTCRSSTRKASRWMRRSCRSCSRARAGAGIGGRQQDRSAAPRIVKEGTLVFVVPGWQSRPVRENLPPEK